MKKALICLTFLMLLAVSTLFAQPMPPQLISPAPGQPDLPPLATELVWFQPDHLPHYVYQVYLSLDPFFPEPPVYEGPAVEYQFGLEFHFPAPLLLPLELYHWKIRVTDSMTQLFSESYEWDFFTGSLPPPEPPLLIYPEDQATDISTGGIDLVFHLNDYQYHVDSFFDIFLDIDPGFPNPEQFSGHLDPDRMDFHYWVPALQNAQTYYWYVRYHHPVEGYILDSQVYSFLTGTYIVPSSTISVTLTNNSSYTGTWAYVTCTGACAPWTRKMTFGTTYYYLVNNGLNPTVTPALPVASPMYFFSPYSRQFSNIQSDQTANFTLNTLLPPPVGTPVPFNLATNVSINIGCLKWNFDQWAGYGTPDAFAVYFPAYEQTPYTIIPYTGKRTEYLAPIPTLAYNTDYTWKVVPFNTDGEAENVEVWSFSTQTEPGPPVLIAPADGEGGVSAEGVNLVFQQPGWTVDSFFDVFCDIDPAFSNPPAYSGPLDPVSGILFEHYLSPLIAEQVYFWKIRHTCGVEVWESPIFQFATAPSTAPRYTVAVTLSTTLQFPSNIWLAPRVSCVPACIPTQVNIPLNNSHNFKVPSGLSPLVTPYPPGPIYYFVPGSQLFPPLSGNQSVTFTMHSLLPGTVVNPIPTIAQQNVSINIGCLKWSYQPNACYSEPDGFNVYFPADAGTPVFIPFTRETEYEMPIGPLAYGTDYTWKVAPVNSEGEAEFVEVWDFSTQTQPGPPVLISPPNGEEGVSAEEVTLLFEQPGWTPDSFFDIFVDMDPAFPEEPIYSGPLIPTSGILLSHEIGPLMAEQLFHWKVRVTQGLDQWTSTVHSFSTGAYVVPTHSVSGTLYSQSGIATGGRKITYYANGVYMGFVNSSSNPPYGSYTIHLPDHATRQYTVAPVKPTVFQYWNPSSRPYTNLSSDQTGQDYHLYSYTPNQVTQPVPLDLATNVSVNIGQLQWSYLQQPNYGEPVAFEVYFPAGSPDPYAVVPYVRDPIYTVDIPPLEYDTEYDWKVVPYNDYGWAEDLEEWYFTTESDPFWPGDLYIYPSDHQSGVEDAGLVMMWGTPDEEREDWPVDSFFDVWVDIDPDFTGLDPIYSGPGLISPLNPLRRYCHAPQLQLGTLYYWRIRLTLTGTMEEHYSPIWDFITQDTQIGWPPPILVSPPDLAEAVPPRHTPFVWEMGNYPPDSFFDVFVSIDPDFPEPPIYTGPGIPVFPYVARWVYEHSLLLDEQAYYWYVRVNDLIDHWYRNSDVWEFTTGGYIPPEPPILVSPPDGISGLLPESVELEWETDPDWWVESFFDVFCDVDPGFPAPPVYSGTGSELLVDGIFVLPLSDLLPGVTYHWYVRITDVLTEYSSNSEIWTFSTAGGYLPPPDISIDAEGVLHWLPVDGADGYRIYRSFDPLIDFTPIHETTELFWADPEYLTLPRAFYHVTAITMP